MTIRNQLKINNKQVVSRKREICYKKKSNCLEIK